MHVGAVLITLLGSSTWSRPGHGPVSLFSKDAALIARLALDGPQSRLSLCELLWPERGNSQAEANLRQRASRLHRATGLKVVEVGPQVQLSAEVVVDVLSIEAFDNDALMRAGVLLAGHDLGQNDELDRWLDQARSRVASAIAKELTDRAEFLESKGRLRDALPLAARAVELLPLSEHGWRRLIRLHYLRNDLAAARESCLRVVGVLRDELGARPSEETLQLMQTVEAVEPAGPLSRRPVPASLLRPPVLIGRQQVWQAMSAAWQRHQPFLLTGDAGQGKTRLLEEFLQQQEGIVRDKAQPGDEPSPYAVLGRLILEIDRHFEPELMPSVRQELARIRPEFGAPPDSAADGPLLWHAVEQAIAAALPLGLAGIVVDDLHNADVATIEAMCWLSARPALALFKIGMATRPLPQGPSASAVATWLGASHHPVELQLEALTPDELASLLSSLALPSLLDRHMADRLYRHAGGHLLFTLATLQDAVARGAGFGGEGLPRPNSIQALLDERLRGLPNDARSLMRIAAVAGTDFTAERAATLLGKPVLELVDSWSALEAADVLRGEAFSHDLVHESALRSVPDGLRLALHRQLAELIDGDATAPPSRVAWHWEQGGRWAEAARCWHAAGDLARVAGRLDEQIEFHEHAAALHGRAGNRTARYEALLERAKGIRMRSGGAAALAALAEADAIADTGEQRLRCQIARAQAWLDGGHGEEAAKAAAAAVREAEFHARWQCEAGVMHAQALSQCGRFDEALIAGGRALEVADRGPPRQKLSALSAMSFANYASGRLAEAVRWQRESVAEAERQGDQPTAIINEGNVAALLASIGDVPATYELAKRSRDRHASIRIGDNSTFGIVNHIVLGAAAAALGRFDEALDSLQDAVAAAGEEATPLARAKSRLALAQLWLILGRTDKAFTLLETLPDQIIPGMAIQAAWMRMKAAEQAGLPASRHWQSLAGLAAEHRNLPLVQSAWFEVSYVGSADEGLSDLRRAREQCEAGGLVGTARSMRWRELVLWLDSASPAATERAHAIGIDLEPHVDGGLSAKCYPPEVWWSLARAFERSGDEKRRANALASARRWVETALPRTPEPYRQDFMRRNLINARLLAPRPSGAQR